MKVYDQDDGNGVRETIQTDYLADTRQANAETKVKHEKPKTTVRRKKSKDTKTLPWNYKASNGVTFLNITDGIAYIDQCDKFGHTMGNRAIFLTIKGSVRPIYSAWQNKKRETWPS